MKWLSLLVAVALVPLVPLLVSCGGKGAKAPAAEAAPEADPLALLPSAAIALANIDARALFDSPDIGSKLAELTDKLLPLGPDAGFDARRDVDRIVLGSYALNGADVAAIVTGRFDETKLAAVTNSKGGAPIAKTLYAGTATYAVDQGIYAVLSAKTIVAGTSDGVRRVLDRIHDGKTGRAMPAWVVDTLQTPGATVAIAGDFATQPLASLAIGAIRVPWTEGLKEVRALVDFKAPGMNVAATLTYTTDAQASGAAAGVQSLGKMVKLLGPMLGGVSLQSLDVQTKAADVQVKVSVDEQTLGHLLAMAPRVMPGAQ